MDKDSYPTTNQVSPSDGIVVYDSFYQGTVSRKLSLASACKFFSDRHISQLLYTSIFKLGRDT